MFVPGILQLPLAISVLVEHFTDFFSLPPALKESSKVDEVSPSADEPNEPRPSRDQSELVSYELFELIQKQEWTPELANQLNNLVEAGIDINLQNPNEFNHSVLVFALLHSRFDWIVSLLANGADVAMADRILMNQYNRTACDFAWKMRNVEVARQLVQADGAFPIDFGSELSFVDNVLAKRIKLYVKSGEKLHKNIERNNLKKVEKFVRKNPKVKIVYNYRNQNALSTALKQRNFDVYSFLRSKGFTNGIDSSHDEIMRSLKSSEAKNLEACKKRYFKSATNHVLEMVSKSRVESNGEEDIKTVREYFEDLDNIPELQPILKIISNQTCLSIAFNFLNQKMPLSQGKSGVLTIHTNSDTKAGNLEITARELTLHVFATMYQNGGLPFSRDDDKPRKHFEKALQSFRMNFSENEMMKATDFDENIPLELVIPKLMILYVRHPSKFTEIRENMKHIAEFYDKWVLPEVINELSLIESGIRVQELNKRLATVSQLKLNNLNCISHKDELTQILIENDNISISSQTPELVLTNFIRNFNANNEIDSTHIFVTLKQLASEEKIEMIHEALESELRLTLVVLDSNDVDFDIVTQVLSGLLEVAMKIVFATSRQHLKLQEWFPKRFEINFKYEDLDKRSKDAVLEANINFQGADVALEEVLGGIFNFFQDLPLENVYQLGNSSTKIEFKETLPALSEIFVARTFETSTNSWRTSENMIALVESGDTILIEGASGIGKTTSAVHFAKALKQRNKLSWVAFIDWKQVNRECFEDKEVDADFIAKQLLGLKNAFEQKLFEHFYDKANVIFVIDDIYNGNFERRFLKTLQTSGNRLLVISSLHSSNEIEEMLATESIKLLPFVEDNQIEFLYQFWRKTWKKGRATNFEVKAQSFVQKARKLSIENKVLEVPLHFSMFVDLFSDSELQNLSLNSLYTQFINKKIKSVNGIKVNGSVEEHSSAAYKFHQKIAIDGLLGRLPAKLMTLPENFNAYDILSSELLDKMKDGRLQFVHQSVAEYFLAKTFFEQAKVEVSAETAAEMFVEILINVKFQSTREFIDDKLQTEAESFYTEAFEQKLAKLLRDPSNQGILHFLIKEQNANLLTFVLRTLNLRPMTTHQLLTHKNRYGNEALHSAVELNDIFKALWSHIEEFLDESSKKALLMAKGQHGRDVLNQALHRNESLHEPKLRRSNAFLRLLSQKIEDRKQDILKPSGRCDIRDTVKLILDLCTRLLDPEWFSKVLLAVDDYGDSTIHFIFESRSIEVVNEILDRISAKLDGSQIEYLLSQRSPKGQTVLHRLCNNKSALTTSVLWDFINKTLNQDAIASLLFTKAGWEGNVFNMAAYSNHSILSDFLEWLKDKPFELIEKVFFTRNRDSWTFLHFVTWRCTESLTSKVFELISEFFTGEGIEKLLLAEDRNGMTPQKRSLGNKCKLTAELVCAVYENVLKASDSHEL